ncbi:glycosyltransferase family 2 protein [Agilicoccus flavus]|uniref:glycosyltransferase family 2 protein n=1 Tax=Agilicoccus flavus TaxID=2775968 RepID=UPI001CF6691B|nr:glycosyltransferase family 2 protein [Agilicoccus flavus]
MPFDVSYIVAAHDAQDTIRATIESALAQTDVTVEVVVVDDASSDGTAEAARASGDDRVRVVVLERNLGPGGARNVGLDLATGEWVGVLDADDTITPGRSRAMVGRAQAAGADVVVDNIEIIDVAAGTTRLMYTADAFRRPASLTLADYVDGNIMLDRSVPYAYGYLQPLVRRSLLEREGLRYDEDLRIGEDFYFFAAALAHSGPFVTEPSAGYRYLVREGSTSSRLHLDSARKMRAADDEFRARHDLDPEALAALARRSASLDEAIDFLELREGVHRRDLTGAARIVLRRPAVVRHLRIPLEAKLTRLRRRSGGGPAEG